MGALNISDVLKYANLQVAAETFIRNEKTGSFSSSGQPLVDVVSAGNRHASRLPEILAEEFSDPTTGWTVLDQRAISSIGFSGTLFINNKTNELVLSMRSTEFIDDAGRDSQATNALEVKNMGWTFGQIADMEKWYPDLQNRKDPNGELVLSSEHCPDSIAWGGS